MDSRSRAQSAMNRINKQANLGNFALTSGKCAANSGEGRDARREQQPIPAVTAVTGQKALENGKEERKEKSAAKSGITGLSRRRESGIGNRELLSRVGSGERVESETWDQLGKL